jgi:iron(III) transport system ATP-binding protein
MTEAVRCQELAKAFQDVVAVDGVDLTVAQGQILAVLGPSGCGKTTLLRLIAGFETPDGGSVSIAGKLVAGASTFVPPEKRRVGMVFQSHALFPHLTVEENIKYGVPRASRRNGNDPADHLMALTGLTGLRARHPHELSGGESQRVALARALASRPVFVLLDEPFSNLDADRRVRIREEVRFILKQTGTTAIFVTHDQEEGLFMGDLVAIMRAGKVVQLGKPEEVFHAPATRFVAEFLGHTEFLPATSSPQGLVTELGTLPQRVALPAGTPLEVGFRADDLTFGADPRGESIILARVFQGPWNTYRIRLPSGRIVHSLQPHTERLQPGTRIRAWFAPNHPLPCFVDGRAVPSSP